MAKRSMPPIVLDGFEESRDLQMAPMSGPDSERVFGPTELTLRLECLGFTLWVKANPAFADVLRAYFDAPNESP